MAVSALLALFMLLSPSQLRAQLVTGDVLGTVMDSTSAVVPGARVTLTNTGTGIASSMTTNETGEFLFSNVQIGAFKVTVEAKGFKTFNVANIALAAGQRLRVNAQLQVGSQVESVQVEASAAVQLQSDSSDINSAISARAVADMPLNGRNYYDLLALQPGTTSVTSGSGGPTDARPTMSFSASGLDSVYNSNLIDGIDNNERSLGSIAVEPSLDALQEVQVETSNYSAEYGRAGGGIANLVTKSGTNKFSGTLFEFMRNDDFDAYAWEPSGTAKTKTELRQNQFGGSLGGPIVKNKAFFFGDYQGWRLVNGGIQKQLVPTQAEYDAIHAYSKGTASTIALKDQFDAFQGTSPIIVTTSQVNALGLAYLMQAPPPLASCTGTYGGFTNLCGSTYNWYGAANTRQHADTYDGRIDYHFNEKNTLFGRFSYNKTTTETPGNGFPATQILNGDAHTYQPHDQINPVIDTNLALDYVHIFNAKTLYEAKASYLRSNEQSYSSSTKYWTMDLLGIPCTSAYCYNSDGVGGFPMVRAGGQTYGTYATASPAASYGIAGDEGYRAYTENTYQYYSTLTLNRKSHSLKVGVTLVRRQINAPSPSVSSLGFTANYTGNALADMLEGLAVTASGRHTMIVPRLRIWEPSAYIQDDWRATSSLTLNLGVRYDLYPAAVDKYGNLSNFDLNTDLVVSPNLLGANNSSPTGNVKTDYRDVSPRVGFAYSPNRDNVVLKNMVLRGGLGLSYFPISGTGQHAGNSRFQMLNAPYVWSMGCGAAGYTNPACSGTNGLLTDSQYSAQPYALSDGGFNLEYGLPRAIYNTALATETSEYAASLASATFFLPDAKPSYVAQFNFQLQKQAGNNIFTAGFVGILGRRMPTVQNINQPLSAANLVAGIYPLNSSSASWMKGVDVGEVITGANSAWEAGEATYERRFTAGLSASVNYTWARAESQGTNTSECVFYGCPMDNGSGTAIPVNGWKQYNYDGSTSHRAAGMVSYNIPSGKNLRGVMGAMVKGWALNGTGYWNTGAWSQVTSSGNQSGILNSSGTMDSSATGDFPNLVPGVSVKPARQTLSHWINENAFALQTAGMLGNGNKSTVQAPRTRNADLGLGKTFSLLEGFKLQFRAEAFNFTNTPSYSFSSGGGGGGPPPPGGGGGTTSISCYVSQPCSGVSTGTPVATASGGFGDINSVSSDPRIFQFGMKLIY
jgi:hypothetical protein